MDLAFRILELISLLSVPVIAVVAIIALKQLAIAKATTRLAAKRDSLRLAASESARYIESVIPAVNRLDQAIDDGGITFFSDAEVTVGEGVIQVALSGDETTSSVLSVVALEVTEAFNLLESFSVFFVSGVADEGVAFNAIGSTFCNTVHGFLPLLVMFNEQGKHYQNVLDLFYIWHGRQQRRKLLQEQMELDNKLAAVKVGRIKPLGT